MEIFYISNDKIIHWAPFIVETFSIWPTKYCIWDGIRLGSERNLLWQNKTESNQMRQLSKYLHFVGRHSLLMLLLNLMIYQMVWCTKCLLWISSKGFRIRQWKLGNSNHFNCIHMICAFAKRAGTLQLNNSICRAKNNFILLTCFFSIPFNHLLRRQTD